MKFHELNVESNKRPRRSGRGISAGRGKTAGRGTKGQKARKSGNVRPGFEGGQSPLTSRLPKLPGFVSRRPQAQTVTLASINTVSAKNVTAVELKAAGKIKTIYRPVRVVATGTLDSAKTIKLQGITERAAEAVKKAGGSFSVVPTARRNQNKTAL